jgi:hypothetical protein
MTKKSNKKAAKRKAAKKNNAMKGVSVAGAADRVMVASLKSHPIFGGRLTSNSLSLPSAFVNIIGNSTSYSETSKVLMPDLGLMPVNIIGTQPFADVVTAAASNNLFTNTTLATQQDPNTYQLNPDSFNGPLAAKANLYDKFIFRDLLFEYVSLVATSQAGGMSMGCLEDGTNPPTTFSMTRQVVPSVAFPFRTDRAFLHYHYAGPQLFYNLTFIGSNESIRQTSQGAFVGWPSVTSIGAISQGFINVYYSVDLYDPVNSQGFTLSVSKMERDLVRQYLFDLRNEEGKTKGVTTSPAPRYLR